MKGTATRLQKKKSSRPVGVKALSSKVNLRSVFQSLEKLLVQVKWPIIKTVTGRGYKFVANVEIVRKKGGNVRQPHLFTHNSTRPKTTFIAVLPLRNENGDKEIDYLADGTTESLIITLS